MIDFQCEKPIYRQIEEIFTDNIKSGKWPVHSKIKDEITLSVELGVSRGTLRKSMKELINKGVLSKVKGKGTFVVSNFIEQPLATRLISFSEAMEEKGMDYSTVVINVEKIKPGPKVAAFLEIPDSQGVFCLKRVRLVEKQPIMYLENYIPALLCPRLETEDFEKRTLFSVIEDKYNHKLSWGRRYFKAVPAIGDIAFNLSLQPGTPVLYLEQVMYSTNTQPIEYSNVWINSERFDIVSVLSR